MSANQRVKGSSEVSSKNLVLLQEIQDLRKEVGGQNTLAFTWGPW